MVDLGTECIAGAGSLSYPGEAFGHLSAFDGAGYTDVIFLAFLTDHTFYYIVRQTDGEDQ